MRAADGAVVFPSPRTSAGTDTGRAVVSRADDPAAAPSPAPSNGTHPEGAAAAPDLAAMEDALYERIEYRLRTDLMLERERTGSLPDF